MQFHDDPNWMPAFTGPFADTVAQFVSHKRALGFAFGETSCYRLRSMDRLFGEMGCDGQSITWEMVDAYCRAEGRSEQEVYQRRCAIGDFCRYLVSRGWQDVVIPEPGCSPRGRFIPYIYSHEEIARIFGSAQARAGDARGRGFYALLCLCYTCGLRRSEAGNLRVSDVDLGAGVLNINHSKNDRSRMVAMSASTGAVIAGCIGKLQGASPDRFVIRDGLAIHSWHKFMYNRWGETLADARIGARSDGSRPRIHDLRHSFCAHVLERLDAQGRDIRAAFPMLSAYLGHRNLAETEYYLRLSQPVYREVSAAAESLLPNLYGKEARDGAE